MTISLPYHCSNLAKKRKKKTIAILLGVFVGRAGLDLDISKPSLALEKLTQAQHGPWKLGPRPPFNQSSRAEPGVLSFLWPFEQFLGLHLFHVRAGPGFGLSIT